MAFEKKLETVFLAGDDIDDDPSRRVKNSSTLEKQN